MDLSREEYRLLYGALMNERDRTDEGFTLLSTLGYRYETDVWKSLVNHRTKINQLLLTVGEELS